MRMFKKRNESAGSWDQLYLNYIQPNEFGQILVTLFQDRINIAFQPDVDIDAEATEAYELTGGQWPLLADYIDAIDVTLGGDKERPRCVDKATMQRAKKRFRENTVYRPRPSQPMGVPNDFTALVSLLVTTTLHARFEEELNREVVAAEWFEATEGAWPALEVLVTCLNQVLNETTSELESSSPRLLDQQKLNEAYRRYNEQSTATDNA